MTDETPASLLEGTVTGFVEACARRSPTPGGGAGAALIGAVGAALGEMAARFSKEEAGGPVAASLARIRTSLLEAAVLDCEVYGRLRDAYRHPLPNQEAVQEATREAMRVPLEAARACLEGLRIIAEAVGRLNRNLVSDAGICALGLEAGLQGLLLNVRINARALPDGKEIQVRSLAEEGASPTSAVGAKSERFSGGLRAQNSAVAPYAAFGLPETDVVPTYPVEAG
ncbi:MAG: cyclodeaminase/cyclohydrolase family protein, partial [Planctomycetota bacterium]